MTSSEVALQTEAAELHFWIEIAERAENELASLQAQSCVVVSHTEDPSVSDSLFSWSRISHFAQGQSDTNTSANPAQE